MFTLSNKLSINPTQASSILQINGNAGMIFKITPNGEFVLGEGVSETEGFTKFSTMIYGNMEIVGKSFSKLLTEKQERILALERELEILKNEIKNGTQNNS